MWMRAEETTMEAKKKAIDMKNEKYEQKYDELKDEEGKLVELDDRLSAVEKKVRGKVV
jgi:hypothetical protein